jgi:hypothetical protein
MSKEPTKEPTPGILMSNSDVINITESDFRRLHQRMNMGGILEGAYGLDNGMVISLAQIIAMSPNGKMFG